MDKNTCVIKLNTIDKVKDFVSCVSTFDCDVDILYRRYILDAKSIMALLSADLTEPLKVVIHTDDYDELKRFFDIMDSLLSN